MLVMRTKPNNSDPRQILPSIFLLAAAVFCLEVSRSTAAAQVNSGKAIVTRSAPGAILYSGGAPYVLSKGATLQPDDVIDTRASGRVVIALGDGSQVVIFPGSRVELKNFRAGVPWRDLLRVMVGRVRATINHHGKRPNPYRVFSPVASIAVRGTDFLVTVEPSGRTRVLVYEGLVEVGSLINPQKTVLVRPGRNIIVRPDGDVSLVMSAPRAELNEIKSLSAGWGPEANLRGAYNGHGNSYTGLRSSRFTAFNDSHLDSLQNPAYATEFRQPRGRFFMAPAFTPAAITISPNYTLSPQVSYFMPLGSRTVVGGGAVVSRTDIRGDESQSYFNFQDQTVGYNHFDGKVKFTTANLSLIAARRFGRTGRTSFGMKFDYLIDRSSYSFNKDIAQSKNFEPALEEGEARGRRAGLSVGVTQDVGDDKKLGAYYRYSMGSVENSYRRSGFWGFINNDDHYFPGSEDFRTRPGHSSEAGVLFRGSVTRRLFYGVESSILFEQDQAEANQSISTMIRDITYVSAQTYLNRRRARQGMIGVGIGYALRSNTVLSLDLSAGRARRDSLGQTHYSSLPPGIRYGAYDSYAHEQTSFRAWHVGGQTDVWRNFFVGASLFTIGEEKRSISGLDVPAESHRPFTTYSQEGWSYDRYNLANLSAGLRLAPGWITQFVYSNVYFNHGTSTPSYTLVIRHEFGRKEEK